MSTAEAPVHFLHIPKTGGTALREALSPQIAAGKIVWHGHGVRLCDLPATVPIGFCLRDPLARFVSGFNSRLRRGRPRYEGIPWTPEQAEVFKEFTSPNDLAESLTSADQATRARAVAGIGHIGLIQSYRFWFSGIEEITERLHQIIFIGRQERLGEDFIDLKQRLHLPPELSLPLDDVKAHRSPPDSNRYLSPLAINNLTSYYSWDIDLYERIFRFKVNLSAKLIT